MESFRINVVGTNAVSQAWQSTFKLAEFSANWQFIGHALLSISFNSLHSHLPG